MAPTKVSRPRRKRRDQLRIGNCVLAERKPRFQKGFDKGLARLAELDRLIADRHGQFVPQEHLDTFLTVAALCMKDAHGWLARYAPYLDDFDAAVEPIQRANEWRRWNLNTEEAGAKLVLTFDERQRLGIVTMWAADLPIGEQKAAVKQAKLERDRLRIAEKRKEKRKSKPRSEWLAEHTLQQGRPWEAEGISRRTWYYRQKQNCTGMSPLAQDGRCTGMSPLACTGMSQPESSEGTLILTSDALVQTSPTEPPLEDQEQTGGGVKPTAEACVPQQQQTSQKIIDGSGAEMTGREPPVSGAQLSLFSEKTE